MKTLAVALLCLCFFSCKREKTASTSSTDSLNSSTASRTPIEVEFIRLSNFELPIADPTMAEKKDIIFISKALPEEVRELNNKKITIKGFMFPLEYTKEEKIDTFLLTPDQGACCFGKVPALNGVIFCESKKGYPDLRDTLLEITGTLTSEPSYNKRDEAVYLYKMAIDSIKELKVMPPIQRPGLSY